MIRSKLPAFVVASVLALQLCTPMAYAGVFQGQGPEQPSAPTIVPGDDPSDTIVPDTYLDLPTPFSDTSTLSTDDQTNYMWTPATRDFQRSIDYTQPPQDPENWVPNPNPPINPTDGRFFRPLPWEVRGGGGGGSPLPFIQPQPIPPSPGRGVTPTPNRGGTAPPPSTGGGGGGGGGTGGDITGQMNTNTGTMDLAIPIVSFSGPGQGDVDLSLQFKQFDPYPSTRPFTDNYNVRLDVRKAAGTAIVTFPSGLALPFTRSGPAPGPGTVGDGDYTGPKGIRAILTNPGGLGYRIRWKNGDEWFFGGGNTGQQFGHLTYIGFKKGGAVGIQRTLNSATISTGTRSATITYNSASLPAGVLARITAPNGTTDVANSGGGFEVRFPGGVKRVRLFYLTVTSHFIAPGGGGGIFILGNRFSGYQDAKLVAANSNLRYTYQYDSLGRVNAIFDPSGSVVRYAYVSPGQTRITDQEGNVSWDYYRDGEYVGGKDEAGFTTEIVRNADHEVIRYRNERNRTWTVARSASGDATSITNPANETWTYGYDSYGNVVSATDPLGNQTQINRDLRTNVTSAENALQQTVLSVQYDLNGQATTVTDISGRQTSVSYYANGDVEAVTGPDGLTTTALYNALGLPTRVTAPGNRATRFEYDTLSRLTAVIDPANSRVEFEYDLNDNIVTTCDALNGASNYTFDVLNRLVSASNPRGDTENYTYSSGGNLLSVRNGRGKTRTYQYSARGEVKYLRLPDGTTEFYDFYGDGNLANFRGSGRQNIRYLYDEVGRLSVVDYLTITDTSFTYDAAGRRISMVDGTGQTSWFYDALGRVTTLNQAGKVTTYEYNLDGARSRLTQPEGSTTYGYDSLGRPSTITNPFGELTRFTYDSLGRVNQKFLASGQFESYEYDLLDRLTTLTLRRSTNNQVLNTESYAYNEASEIISKTENGVTTQYNYDAASQLISEIRPGYSASYTFDGNGNRLTKTVNGVTESYTYDDGDKLLTAGTKTYTYDLAGRTIRVVNQGQVTNLTYDAEDRLVSLVGPSGTHTYTYNGLDTRVAKNAGGSVTAYHRDGVGVTAPVIADTGAVYTPGVSERRGGVTTFTHSGLKNNSVQTNVSQTVTASRQYDAYGQLVGASGTWAGPFGYGGGFGYQTDETGLQLLGHRYYDSSTGRFLTRDPIKAGRNWYVYCDGNPIMRFDPDGRDWLEDGANFFGGWGHALTFGATGALAQAINNGLGNGEFSYGGACFNAGLAVGTVHSIALTGARALAVRPVRDTVVYIAVLDNQVSYVGITSNFVRRQAEHAARFVIKRLPGLGPLTRLEARAVEQCLIELHGLQKNGGSLLNKINSISKKNKDYAELLKTGRRILKKAGYAGIE